MITASKTFPAFIRHLEERGSGGLSFRRLCLRFGVSPLLMNRYLVRHFGLTGEQVISLYEGGWYK